GWWPSTWSASPSASASIPTCRSGPPASTCFPPPEGNSADPFHDRGVATATTGACVTHGTKRSAAVGGPRWCGPGDLPAPAPYECTHGGGGEPEEGRHLADRRVCHLLCHPAAGEVGRRGPQRRPRPRL